MSLFLTSLLIPGPNRQPVERFVRLRHYPGRCEVSEAQGSGCLRKLLMWHFVLAVEVDADGLQVGGSGEYESRMKEWG